MTLKAHEQAKQVSYLQSFARTVRIVSLFRVLVHFCAVSFTGSSQGDEIARGGTTRRYGTNFAVHIFGDYHLTTKPLKKLHEPCNKKIELVEAEE